MQPSPDKQLLTVVDNDTQEHKHLFALVFYISATTCRIKTILWLLAVVVVMVFKPIGHKLSSIFSFFAHISKTNSGLEINPVQLQKKAKNEEMS